VNGCWEKLLVLLKLRRRQTYSYWSWRSNARVLSDHELIFQLYYELSKGGCKDFTEQIVYIRDPEIMDDDPYTQVYSHLVFKPRMLSIGGWRETNLILGNANCLCEK